jgi:hypothetical protein
VTVSINEQLPENEKVRTKHVAFDAILNTSLQEDAQMQHCDTVGSSEYVAWKD